MLPAVDYFRKYSKLQFIELDGDQPVEQYSRAPLEGFLANSD